MLGAGRAWRVIRDRIDQHAGIGNARCQRQNPAQQHQQRDAATESVVRAASLAALALTARRSPPSPGDMCCADVRTDPEPLPLACRTVI